MGPAAVLTIACADTPAAVTAYDALGARARLVIDGVIRQDEVGLFIETSDGVRFALEPDDRVALLPGQSS